MREPWIFPAQRQLNEFLMNNPYAHSRFSAAVQPQNDSLVWFSRSRIAGTFRNRHLLTLYLSCERANQRCYFFGFSVNFVRRIVYFTWTAKRWLCFIDIFIIITFKRGHKTQDFSYFKKDCIDWYECMVQVATVSALQTKKSNRWLVAWERVWRGNLIEKCEDSKLNPTFCVPLLNILFPAALEDKILRSRRIQESWIVSEYHSLRQWFSRLGTACLF